MKTTNSIARYLSVTLALAISGPAQSAEIRIACDESNNLDARMAARYIHTPARAVFDVSFKAPASSGLVARDSLEVRVDGYVVGYAELAPRAGGALGASLSFDSYANSGYSVNGAVMPFPAGWVRAS